MKTHPVTLDDIRAAQKALAGVVVRTPVLENADVNAMLGGRLLLKAENFQRTGAFKIRGAYNRIVNLHATRQSFFYRTQLPGYKCSILFYFCL